MSLPDEDRGARPPDCGRRAGVRVGLAGWSYADWRGAFYPENRDKEFSELRYVASLFDCVEINVTFYRDIARKTIESWIEKVEGHPAFTFTLKLHRDLTHADAIEPAQLHDRCVSLKSAWHPLVASGRLGAVLVQFPWYFEDRTSSRRRIETLCEALRPLPLAIELRHRSFFDTGAGGGLPWLESLGLNLAVIDLPRSSTTPPWGSFNTGPVGYFRLHGRNSRNWFARDAGRDAKYDYLYTQAELVELLPAVERVAARTETTYVITNNHFNGQAAANALQIIDLLGRPVTVPETLQKTFPFLLKAT